MSLEQLTEDIKKLAISTIQSKYKVSVVKELAIKKGINVAQTKKLLINDLKNINHSPMKKIIKRKEKKRVIRKVKIKARNEEKINILQNTNQPKHEKWKRIKQFSGNRQTSSIEISNLGRVKKISTSGKVKISFGGLAKGGKNIRGKDKTRNKDQRNIVFSENKKTQSFGVHQLVMELFGPKPKQKGMQIEHLDKDNENNKLNNLIWSTRKDIVAGMKVRPAQIKLLRTKKGTISQINNLDGSVSIRFQFSINRKTKTRTFSSKRLAEIAQQEYINKINRIESGELMSTSLSFF